MIFENIKVECLVYDSRNNHFDYHLRSSKMNFQ